jgi:toluene monooxygenase system ferredoxin subunit
MSWKRVCAAEEVGENSLRKFEVDGIAIIVANYGGGYRAFPPLCPHMEEPLAESGLMDSGRLTCSKHLWQWDLRSGDVLGAAEKPLLFYELKQEGGDLLALLESELVYDYDAEDEFDDDDFFNS